jgi:pilus assembly protein CpaF
VRGAEAFDLIQAMATGHQGSMGTIHAAHAYGALLRLESLILLADLNWSLENIRAQIAEWVRIVIHVMRDAEGRFIQEIQRVEGLRDGEYVLSPLTLH